MKYRINRKTGDRISEIGIGSSYMYNAGMDEAVKALLLYYPLSSPKQGFDC